MSGTTIPVDSDVTAAGDVLVVAQSPAVAVQDARDCAMGSLSEATTPEQINQAPRALRLADIMFREAKLFSAMQITNAKAALAAAHRRVSSQHTYSADTAS